MLRPVLLYARTTDDRVQGHAALQDALKLPYITEGHIRTKVRFTGSSMLRKRAIGGLYQRKDCQVGVG